MKINLLQGGKTVFTDTVQNFIEDSVSRRGRATDAGIVERNQTVINNLLDSYARLISTLVDRGILNGEDVEFISLNHYQVELTFKGDTE